VIRVVIADDQALVREGFAAILSRESDIEVVSCVGDGQQAIRSARATRPDVVLMDIRMPVLDGIAATEELLRWADAPRILILTTFDLDEYVYQAMRAGASGFLLKDAPPGRLADAIRIVVAGEMLIDPAVARRLVEQYVRVTPARAELQDALATLSSRETDILRELARGATNIEIAERLYVSPATVKTHVANILRKLGLRDRVQAVVFAYESGLREPGTS